jgi:hypothetical protein
VRDVEAEPEGELPEETEAALDALGTALPVKDTVGEFVAVPEVRCEPDGELLLVRVAACVKDSTAERAGDTEPGTLVLLCVTVGLGEPLTRPTVSLRVGDALRLRVGNGLTDIVGVALREALPRVDTDSLPVAREDAELEGDPEPVRERVGV